MSARRKCAHRHAIATRSHQSQLQHILIGDGYCRLTDSMALDVSVAVGIGRYLRYPAPELVDLVLQLPIDLGL